MKRLILLGALLSIGAMASPPKAAPLAEGPPPSLIATRTLATLPPYVAGPKVTGTIRIWGHGSPKHDFVGDLVRRWFSEFQRGQPGVVLDYRMYGTASAIGALTDGAGTLAILGEEISPAAERMFIRAHGYPPTKIEIANGSVATNYFDYAHMIFVNKANPLAKLTIRQLEAVFGAEHRCTARNIRTWSELGLTGDWARRPITPYAWKTDVDFALFFRERVLCGSHRWNPAAREFMPVTRPDGTVVQHGQLILEALAKDPYGIAISSVVFANSEVKALPIAWDAKRGFVTASDETLIDRRYPLGRIIPAFVDRAPGKPMPPVEREFLRYILSREGQTALVQDSGYLPLDRATLLRELDKLK
ncbi:substrate-binding domain-containing protein [Sphingomonas bacterium]|uniref:PstS family phosphate ABC transporter substrate-binding protein n=1 Tax=Sphingomonas bacterium TaxID=1895847 RepID=UPI0026122686|nr:substrate-binding domain-containing protein [Sphingomonas bacterium]MDB5679495.1 Phosphate transport system substrate-binding protein [Sphingomonas bacterium]